MFMLFLFEVGVFVMVCIILNMILHKPDFKFDQSDLSEIQWSAACSISQHSLQSAFDHSKLLLPLHAALYLRAHFSFVFFAIRQKVQLLVVVSGKKVCLCLCLYPFVISCLIYCWFLYNTYSTIKDEDCIVSVNESNEVSHRINELETFSLNLCLHYLGLLLFMFPTISGVYLTCYKVKRLFCRLLDCCLRGYVHVVTAISCCHCLFVTLTCCCLHGERQVLLQRRQSYQRVQSNNWTTDQRKKLVQLSPGVECLRQYLQTDLKNITSYPRRCWYLNCNTLIAYHEAEYVLNEQQLMIYDQLLVKSSVHNAEQIVIAVMVKPYDRAGLMQCSNSSCRADLCASCGVLWHRNQTCKEFQTYFSRLTEEADAAFDDLVKKQNWRHCPRCGLVVDRIEGCYHMTHMGCEKGDNHRTDFCYFCGEELTKKDGEGWRYSKLTNEKHFPNGKLIVHRCLEVYFNSYYCLHYLWYYLPYFSFYYSWRNNDFVFFSFVTFLIDFTLHQNSVSSTFIDFDISIILKFFAFIITKFILDSPM
ncbi:IBR domain containing protein [Reticulomyxa filosa]|uniref:IBR domain containing protein n=1 Tax=Reticulomyxa filosa TaxID=46433 RepID=X6NIH8_RETFI|nr:IBR domain containing protein [Reticulomyxa filosa]|eukprot:ETO26130.1 IBR domain containing protein [Reticulomyxa filosa]